MMVKYYSAKSQFNKKMVQYKKKKIQSDESFLEHLANINSPEHHQEALNQMNQGGGTGLTINVSAPLVDETILDTIIPAIQKAQRMNLA